MRNVVAYAGCNDVTLSEIITVGPPGMYTDLTIQDPTNSTVSYLNMYWTPDETQIGFNRACVVATDSGYLPSPTSCMEILVTKESINDPYLENGCAYPTSYLSGEFLAGVNGFMTFRTCFNIPVSRPKNTAYVRIYDFNNTEYLKYDCSTSGFVYYIDNMIFFDVLVNTLPIGDYYVSFDSGVAQGTGYCKTPSPAVTSQYFWPIYVRNESSAVNTSIQNDVESQQLMCLTIIETSSSTNCNLWNFLTLMCIIWFVFLVLHTSILCFVFIASSRKPKIAPIIKNSHFILYVPVSYEYLPK